MAHTHYELRYACHPEDFKRYDTAKIRQDFLLDTLFADDEIRLTYSMYDRLIVGGIRPVKKTLALETIDPLKADYFLERREMGVINVGGPAVITADGQSYQLGYKEALYLGRGTKSVDFASSDASKPAVLYLNSAPAHHAHPCRKVSQSEAEVVELGSLETANARTIRKLIVNSIVPTCQVQMGMTELQTGSVWNTMPAHTHDRRMEAYFYFELPEDQAVAHFMGQPQETRHLFVHNHQAILSPAWSIHCGSGTSNYTFIWGMAGENLDYGDMDHVKIPDLR